MQRLAPASYSRRITSPIQQQAVLLTALLEIDPAHAWIPTLVAKIEASRTNGVWRSTLENAAAISALAKYASLVRQEPANFKGFVRSGVSDPQSFDHTAAKSFRFNQPIQPLQVETTGAGLIYLTQTTTGLRTRPANAEAAHHGLEVRRYWMNHKGKVIDPQRDARTGHQAGLAGSGRRTSAV